ncbi:MAG: phosphatase PAP2 family protein [Candidatus Krumholzibacteriota bacterium]
MWIAIGLSLVCALLVMPGRSRRGEAKVPLLWGTGSHWRRNYSRRSFLRLGGALAAASALAYSGADEAVDSFHSGSLRSRGTDTASHIVNPFGERFWFVNWFLVAAVDAWVRSGSFSRWGRNNFEAMVVGLPVLWTVQRGLGANRPTDEDPNPRWRPMSDDNSASGHAFIAAIPWLNLARRLQGNCPQWAARCASVLTGWSRINDRKHYLSQVVLGWTIAWNAVDAVHGNEESPATDDISKG